MVEVVVFDFGLSMVVGTDGGALASARCFWIWRRNRDRMGHRIWGLCNDSVSAKGLGECCD